MKRIMILAIAAVGMSVGIATFTAERATSVPAEALVLSHIGEMGVGRAAHQATVLRSGEVLITGGCAGDGCTPFHRSAEVYDPSARRFRPAAPMAVPRASHTSTRLHDGRVLVAGGCSTNGATARAEIYDPASERWTRVGDMTTPRCSHIAVPLGDGRVFIMGGGGGRLGELALAEVFDPVTSTFASLGQMRNNPGARAAPDLVQRNVVADRRDQLWVADITYVPAGAGCLYLAVVIDAWSRRVVGWSMETHLRTELVLHALNTAISQRRPKDVIHHSDQGTQYTSIAFGLR
jgi:hypothetical protein